MKTPTEKDLLKPAQNFMRIQLGYSCHIVLPYDEGSKLLAALKHAETYNKEKYDDPFIEAFSEDIETTIISQQRYLNLKMAKLLGVKADELDAQQAKEKTSVKTDP